MASRYWVGGTASWDATAGSKWALTSGGAGGQAVPTTADDVFLDASSGAVTVTLSGTRTGLTITFTGFTGTFDFAGGTLNIVNTAIFAATGTYSSTGGNLGSLSGATNGQTLSITTNGVTLPCIVLTGSTTRTLSFQDNITALGNLNGTGVVTFNNHNSTFLSFSVGASSNWTLGSGTHTLVGATGSPALMSGNSGATFDAGTSTIILDGTNTGITSGTNSTSLTGGPMTYNNVVIQGTDTGDAQIAGTGSTFASLSCIRPGKILKFNLTSSPVITNLTLKGSSTSRMTVKSTTNASQFTITATNATCQYLNVQDSNAVNTIATYDSVNNGNNTKWIFGTTSAGSFLNNFI